MLDSKEKTCFRRVHHMVAEENHKGSIPLDITCHRPVVDTEQNKRKAQEVPFKTMNRKRKAEDEGPSKQSCGPEVRRTRTVQKEELQSVGSLVCCEEYLQTRPVVSKKAKKLFQAKYREVGKLGEGGYGSVMAGIRRSDSKPVAIKHIPKAKVRYTLVKRQGCEYMAVTEAALMAQAAGLLYDGSVANHAVIGLLDLYQLSTELLIVMERPLKSMDLHDFYIHRDLCIPEHEAKTVFRQLVDAAVLMHENGVCHRDIKAGNILVSLDRGKLSIKIIDFGCGYTVKNEPYTHFSATVDFAPPEMFLQGRYDAEPTTVWQIGALLRNLYAERWFETIKYMEGPNSPLDCVSHQCNDFMNKCLTISPKQRPPLAELQRHPWLG